MPQSPIDLQTKMKNIMKKYRGKKTYDHALTFVAKIPVEAELSAELSLKFLISMISEVSTEQI